MTAPIEWPAEATCGRCKWWANYVSGMMNASQVGACKRASRDDGMFYALLYATHREFGCRAWEPKE